jgi:hypothetical protein
MKVEAIKLMPDYGSYPLWWAGSDKAGDIDPASLPLSQETIDRLYRWAEVYDSTLNWDDPANSPGFSNYETEEAFEQEGISLWRQVQRELFPQFKIYYFSNKLGRLMTELEPTATS